MLSNCENIKQLLESNSESRQTLELIEEHFQCCETCSNLIELENRIESELKLALPKNASSVVSISVMEKIDSKEYRLLPKPIFETAYPYLLTILSIIPVIALFWGWNSIKSLFGSISIDGAINKVTGLVNSLPEINNLLPESTLQFMWSSQMITILAVTAALIWVFSIFEMEKAIR